MRMNRFIKGIRILHIWNLVILASHGPVGVLRGSWVWRQGHKSRSLGIRV